MNELINILKNETNSLKEQYVQKTKEWATNHYLFVTKRSGWGVVEWCEYLGITPDLSYNQPQFPKGFYNTENASRRFKLLNETSRLIRIGLDKYVEKEVENAYKHYEESIEKLAFRIEKKGLDISKIKATTSHIDVNINTVLTDGVKQVKAFTIIAEGQVQRPHYRYLIK